jgi:hypothetical protein
MRRSRFVLRLLSKPVEKELAMATRTLIRWSGLALVLAGVIQAGTAFLHPDYTKPGAVFSPLWAPVGLAASLSYLLMVFGLLGIHLRQAEKAGALGLIGFIVALFDTALLVGIHIDKTFFLPYTLQQQPTLKTMADFIATPQQRSAPILPSSCWAWSFIWWGIFCLV